MCCNSHARCAPDEIGGVTLGPRAEDERLRCRCERRGVHNNEGCIRRATAEDMRCDWCRGRGLAEVSPNVRAIYGPSAGLMQYSPDR